MPRKRSPFPGMDPYLEKRWDDVHAALCVGIRSALQPQLPSGLRARVEHRVTLEAPGSEEILYKSYQADTALLESGIPIISAREGTSSSIAVMPEPLQIRILRDERVERWVQIIDVTDGNRVITAIEVLSPSNKRKGKTNESEPLPTILIPCRVTDDDVSLSLQPIIDQIYLDGGHDDIDYTKPLDPPLSTDDAAWVVALIGSSRSRSAFSAD